MTALHGFDFISFIIPSKSKQGKLFSAKGNYLAQGHRLFFFFSLSLPMFSYLPGNEEKSWALGCEAVQRKLPWKAFDLKWLDGRKTSLFRSVFTHSLPGVEELSVAVVKPTRTSRKEVYFGWESLPLAGTLLLSSRLGLNRWMYLLYTFSSSTRIGERGTGCISSFPVDFSARMKWSSKEVI